MGDLLMKKLRIILALSIAIMLVITACVGNEVTVNEDETTNITESKTIVTENETTTLETVIVTEETIPERFGGCLEEVRYNITGRTAQEDLEAILNWHTRSIVVGIPVRITEPGHNMIMQNAINRYEFRITENLSRFDLPEYITVSSQWGHVFEIGEEYLIAPNHSSNSLRDISTITNLHKVVPTRLLTDDDIEHVRKTTAAYREAWQAGGGGDGHEGNVQEFDRRGFLKSFAKYASLDQEYLDLVDVAMKVTIITEAPHLNGFESNYSITHNLEEVLWINPEVEERDIDHLFLQEQLTINEKVEVGGTYIIMMNVSNRVWLPAARNGAIVVADSEMGRAFMEAFAEM